MHWLKQKLDQQRQQNRYRTHKVFDSPQQVHSKIDGKDIISFCSNDYLGLANHPQLRAAFQQGVEDWGVGAGAAHLVNGHRRPHQALEEALAEFTGQPRALLFSTGYMANLAIATALLGRGDSVIQDKLSHASMIDAAQLSAAKRLRYQHVDADSLARQLSNAKGNKLVMTDGVFSMDGNIAPLPEIAQLCKSHDALLMLDDAHGIGVLGETGAGCVEHFGFKQKPIIMGTLGKAFGSFGAFVAADEEVIEALIQFGRSYIYTTATPPALATASLCALNIIKTEPWRREKLHELIALFREQALQLGLDLMPSDTPIQPIIIGDEETCIELSEKLYTDGLHVGAIRPPTVPKGSARLRITLSAEHTEGDVHQLIQSLASHIKPRCASDTCCPLPITI